MKKINPAEISANAIDLIGNRWMLITAGDKEKTNTMTASWGCMGELWHKPVAVTFIRPQRYTLEFVEANDLFTLSFFDSEYRNALSLLGSKSGRDCDKVALAGLTPCLTPDGAAPTFREASLVLRCRKLYADRFRADNFIDPSIVEKIYATGDFHRIFVAEIEAAWVAE